MKTTVKTVEIKALPEAIWAKLQMLDWETWDPDLRCLEAIDGGFIDGGRCRMVMKNGVRVGTRFSHVQPHRRASFWCTGYGGVLKAHGRFEIVPLVGGTRFSYHFGLGGLWGASLMRLAPGRIDEAVLHCAEGLKRVVEAELSEPFEPRLAV